MRRVRARAFPAPAPRAHLSARFVPLSLSACSRLSLPAAPCRYEFNDKRVTRVAPSSVVTANAYVLFYRRREKST